MVVYTCYLNIEILYCLHVFCLSLCFVLLFIFDWSFIMFKCIIPLSFLTLIACGTDTSTPAPVIIVTPVPYATPVYYYTPAPITSPYEDGYYDKQYYATPTPTPAPIQPIIMHQQTNVIVYPTATPTPNYYPPFHHGNRYPRPSYQHRPVQPVHPVAPCFSRGYRGHHGMYNCQHNGRR
jgi:hypothetical protein